MMTVNEKFFIDKTIRSTYFPLEYPPTFQHHLRRATISSFASSIVNNITKQPCWLCRRYVIVQVRHLIEKISDEIVSLSF